MVVGLLLILLLLGFPAFCGDEVISSIKFRFGKDRYRVEVRVTEGVKVYRPKEVSCWNPHRSIEIRGPCRILLMREGREVSEVSLEDCLFVKGEGGWRTPVEPLKVFVNGERPPVVLFTQYGTCATSVRMILLWLDTKSAELKPLNLLSLHGKWEGEIYAQDVEVMGDEIWVRMYDQMLGKCYLHFLRLGEGVYFLAGYFTQAGGAFDLAEKILKKRREQRIY